MAKRPDNPIIIDDMTNIQYGNSSAKDNNCGG